MKTDAIRKEYFASSEKLLSTKPRLDYLDHLKVALTCLVIAHHAGQPYGGSGGFWYYQVSGDAELQLGRFFSVNAGFFMSLFFFISAYFLPASFDRKGGKTFLTQRLERLGVPALFGFLVIVSFMMYAYFINFRGYGEISFFRYYLNVYFGAGGQPSDWSGPSWPDMQFAHLWFLEHLLFYALIYTLIRTWMGQYHHIKHYEKPLRQVTILLFATMLAIITAVVRIFFPLDHWVGFLGFIQAEFFHVPQYASFFVAGMIAYRRNWLQTLSKQVGLTWLTIGVGLAVSYYVGLIQLPVRSGMTLGNVQFAFYETFMCTGISIGLLYLFRAFAQGTNPWLKTLAANAFCVYIIHVPVLVAIQYGLGSTSFPLSIQFILSTVFGIVGSFVISHYIVRKIPYVKTIL